MYIEDLSQVEPKILLFYDYRKFITAVPKKKFVDLGQNVGMVNFFKLVERKLLGSMPRSRLQNSSTVF